MPHLVQMQEKWGKDELLVVTVNFFFGDDEMPKEKYLDEARRILKEKKAATLNLFLDESEDVLGKNLRIMAAPAAYIFDRQGRWSAFGGVDVKGAPSADHKNLEELVERLVKEKKAK